MMQAELKEPGVDYRRVWRVRPCRREGYNKTYVGEFPDGSSVELDYNFARELVRIEYHPSEDGERIYIAVVKKGVLLQERDFATNRVVDLHRRMRPLAKFFQYFPDNHVLRSLDGIYGLPTQSAIPESTRTRDLFTWQNIRHKTVKDLLRDYLRAKRIDENKKRPYHRRLLRRLPADLFDLGMALIPVSLFFKRELSPEGLAFALGTLGFLTGGMDAIWRQRNPLVFKALFFLFPASAILWLKIQLEQWAIFDPMPDFILTYIKAVLSSYV
ncbi:MAG: hypothetical protein F9K24_03970 [Leptonema illini]|jgi:hypothetical protein|uniref:Uncharacterized protein n=1 Tax=Leptonema illini TaxID=183 RepID=A0A833H3F6_9LEPT|nr:MAG: hypothetical protein F9K24_03970 [Leptonema illini]